MPNTGVDAARGAAPVLRVAAGALRDADGTVLLSRRGRHKSYPGQWEFPGGKLEPGETPANALVRELDEELGIQVRAPYPLIQLLHRYPDFVVQLHVFEIRDWVGEPRAMEGQHLEWIAPQRMNAMPLLAADRPIVTALQLPDCYVFTAPGATPEEVSAGLAGLPADALLRLRLPALDDAGYAALARLVCARLGAHRVVVDRLPELAEALGCAVHVTRDRLSVPISGGTCTFASVHDREEIAAAGELGADALVLGPVAETASHPGGEVLGWDGFGALASEAGLPVYAIGGMGLADVDRARARNGRGVAGIGAFWR